MSCTVVDAIMTLAPSSTIAQPGGSIQLDVLLESVIDLRAYQVEIEITQLSGSGTVEVTCPGGVEVDMARADYVFAGQSGVLPVVSCPFMRFGAALLQGGVDVAGPAYLGHLVLDVSGSATPGSTFEISIAADPLSFLRDSNSGAIPMAIGSSFILTIADTVMTCRLTSDTVAPGGSVDLELYLGDVNDLRAYQGTIEIRPLTGAGSVDVTCPDGVEVDATRPDYVFAGPAPVVPEMDCPNLRLGSAFVFATDAVDVIGPKYLGHYTLDVSPNAVEGSTFEIAILPDPDSFLRDASGQPQAIPMGLSMPCRLTIASCGPPTVTAVGPRYVEIVPPAVAGNVALRVTSLDEPCVDAYVDFDPDPSLAALGIARLVAAPVFRAPADWGVVYLGDEEILPDTEYTVRTVCATGSESAGESATAWLWGDVDDSGGSDFDDILCILDAFAGNFANCSLYGVDLRGDVPNGVTDFDDVLAALNAFSGNPYPGIDPCPGP